MLGELALDGGIAAVAGVLPAAIAANARGQRAHLPRGLRAGGGLGARDMAILAPRIAHPARQSHPRRAGAVAARSRPFERRGAPLPDLRDIKGQESAKRALEIAAAGGHNLLMNGPPGSGKSMLAARLPSILPPLTPAELLEVSMIQSVGGLLAERRADGPPAVPRAASFRLDGRAGGRRHQRAAGRGLARPSRRAVPRRAARIPAAGARQPAPAAGDGRGRHRPGQPARGLSRPASSSSRP